MDIQTFLTHLIAWLLGFIAGMLVTRKIFARVIDGREP